MVFLIQENYPPYAISIIEIDPPAVTKAMKFVKQAVGIWRNCLRDNDWTAYPPQTIRVAPEPRITRDPYTLLDDVA